MFDFKKIVEVTKRSVCFLLSGIMALNSFSVFADEEKGQITLIGDTKSGKTALLKKLMGGEFSEEYNETQLPDFQTLTTKTGETIATTCDTSGDENSSMFFVREPYFTNGTVLLLVIPYNTTDCSQYLKKWVDWLGSDINEIKKVKIIITKKEEDLEGRNAALNDQIKTYISEVRNHKIDKEIIETSSKTGYGIDTLKEYLEKSFQPSAIAGLEVFDTWLSQSMHYGITKDVNPLQLVPVNSTANDSQITDKPQETASVDDTRQISTPQVIPGTDDKPTENSPSNNDTPKNSHSKKKWWVIGGGIGAFFVTVGTTATILIKKFKIDLKALFNKHLGHIFKI